MLVNPPAGPVTGTPPSRYRPMRAELGNRRKVCIVGFCSTNRDLTPYDDDSFEIWGLNRGYLFMPSATRWFEMHNRNIFTSQQRRPGKHVQWLNDFKGPVYMHTEFSEIKSAVTFPLAEISDFLFPGIVRIGTWGKRASKDGQSTSGGEDWLSRDAIHATTEEPYLSSSIAYEVALAIYEGFEEIHLYGVDLNTEAEYAWQKPGVEFLLGVAAGKGIKVVLPDNCPLLKGTLYGRGFMSERPEQMSYVQLEGRLKSLQNEMQACQDELHKAAGAHQERHFLMEQMMPGVDHELADIRHKKSAALIQNLQAKSQQISGKIEETAYWLHQTMGGQEPTEAMMQLRAVDDKDLAAEGPQTDVEELLHFDPSQRTNGHNAELALAAVGSD